jgi:hypothetical protein
MDFKANKTVLSTSSCPYRSHGIPRILPNGYSIAAIRGTLVDAVNSGMFDKLIVEKPAFSSSC